MIGTFGDSYMSQISNYTSFHNSTTLLRIFNLKLKPSTSQPTHFREIVRKSSHHVNTNKGGIVKQSGNDVEGYRSQKVLFQPSVCISAKQCKLDTFLLLDNKSRCLIFI